MKFIAATTRKNVPGKTDYEFIYKHTNGQPVLYSTRELAQAKADSLCAAYEHAMYAPRAYEVDQAGSINND